MMTRQELVLTGGRHPARWSAGTCPLCHYPISQGEMIVRRAYRGWTHDPCPVRPVTP